jgi:ribosome-associated protein
MTTIPVKTTQASEKKDVQKLQRAIIDGLEDVKAQDIQVFDTEAVTALFERVIIASGTSNRQTKALAASVRDAVKKAGFATPRMEGEENGEWIIVDCGAAVAHIMQPVIRQYYHLEELWGEKPIKTKLGAPAPIVRKAVKATSDEGTKSPARKTSAARGLATNPAAKKAVPKKTSAVFAPGAAFKVASKTRAVPPTKAPIVNVAVKKAAAAPKAAAKKAPVRKKAPVGKGR